MTRPLLPRAAPALAAAMLVWGCATAPIGDSDQPVAPAVADADGDTILDVHEGDADPDGDRRPAWQDPDSDDDGLPDKREAGDADPLSFPVDSDGDHVPDYLDLDSDNNGVPDAREGRGDTDGDGIGDYAAADDDGDGLHDRLELGEGRVPDTDEDGTPDHRDTDSDGDRIPDALEGHCAHVAPPCDTDGDGLPDYLDTDTDDDGIPDSTERGADGTEPTDTDGDGRPDYRDRDADGDGLDDQREIARLGTDPLRRDSDGDGFSDAAELEVGTDPTDPTSVWDGWYITLDERHQREESLEFSIGVERLDIVFLFAHDGTLNHYDGKLRDSLVSYLTSRWQASVGDPAFGYVALGGYPFPQQTYNGLRPIRVGVPLTTRAANLADWFAANPADIDDNTVRFTAPYEAFRLLTTDAGIDTDCDGVYDEEHDVAPWTARPDDAFSGTAPGRIERDGGLGIRPGFGFRPFARPVFVWVGVLTYTDPGLVHPDPHHLMYEAKNDHDRIGITTLPEVCPAGATRTDAVRTLQDIDATVLMIGADWSHQNPSASFDIEYSVAGFLDELGAVADLDGDGDVEPLYVRADIEQIRATGEDPGAAALAGAALETIENDIDFDAVSLQVEGDTHGLVAAITPARHTGVRKGDDIAFTVTFRGTVPARDGDQVFKLHLNVLTDDADLVGRKDILVIVPGRTAP